MKKSYKIYVFRHGQTVYNKKKIFTGWKDSKLTCEGKEHAKIIARKLKDKKFGIAIQTRLSRSKDTLKAVLKFHPECKKIIEDNRMIERSYGILEGTSHKNFIDRVGERIMDLKVEGDLFVSLGKEDRERVEDFFGKKEYDVVHRGYSIRVPKGESFADVEKRVGEFIKDLKKLVKKERVNVAISAHGNSIRVFRKIMEKKTRKEATSWFIPYDKVFEYEINV